MKVAPPNLVAPLFRRAFTLVELMIAATIGLGLAGTIVLLLLKTATEQRSGFAAITVEDAAYSLQANITTCLRSMSANQGISPQYSSGVYDSAHNLLGYKAVVVFAPQTNASYMTASISFDPATGAVVYIPNTAVPSAAILWMTNSAAVALTNLCFSTSIRPDGSRDSSLVNVFFQMDDHGFTQHNPVNNQASLFRNFSVQMRNDN